LDNVKRGSWQGEPTPTALVSLFLVGAATTAVQTLLARAFLAAFGGNEAVLATLLGAWLAAGAAGAALGRARTAGADHALTLYPPLAAAAIVAARLAPATFPVGAAPGLGAALFWSLALAGPPCVAAGAAFAGLARHPGAGRAFAFESIGAAAAGALLSVWLLGRVPDLALAAGAVLAATAAGALASRRRLAVAALGFAAAATLAHPALGRWTLSAQGAWLAGAEERPSPTSWLVLSRASGEPVLYADRAPVAAGPDRAGAEETIHLPLALHPAPRSVAIIGVPPAGAMAELRRHAPESVEVVVEDAGLLAALRADFPEWAAPDLRAVAVDARRFLAQRPGRFDVVLLVSPEPTSAQRNRAFTVERFAAVRRALRPGGIVMVALPGHGAAAPLETRRLHSSIARTLASAAGAPLVLPAGRTLYIAGRPDLPSPERAAKTVAAALAARGIAPAHLTPAVLDALLSTQRMADAARWSSLPEPVNRDLSPTTYRLALAQRLAQSGDAGGTALLLLAAALLAATLLALGPRSRPVELAVAASGATGIGLQLALLLAFQIGTGALYRELGLLVAGYMAGTAAGAWLGRRGEARRLVVGAALGQALVALLLALAAPLVAGGGETARPVAVAATFLAGLLPGVQFAAAGRALAGSGAAGTLWAADLAGAAFCSLLLLTFAVPALGVRGAIGALGALQLAAAALLLLPRRAPAGAERPSRLLPSVPLAFAAAVALAGWPATDLSFQALALGLPWRIAALLALGAAFAASLELPPLEAARARVQAGLARLRAETRLAPARLLSFAALLPAAAFPAARCYFAVPFLFCHVCPRPCVFGWLRPWAVPVALAANLFDGRFCQRVCPLGTVQSACLTLSTRPPLRLRGAGALRLAVLAFTAAAYFVVEAGKEAEIQGSGLYVALFKNSWSPSPTVLAVAALLLLASFRWRRPFCEALCPIGAASALVGPAESRLAPLGAGRAATTGAEAHE
jgi:spermidine synthase